MFLKRWKLLFLPIGFSLVVRYGQRRKDVTGWPLKPHKEKKTVIRVHRTYRINIPHRSSHGISYGGINKRNTAMRFFLHNKHLYIFTNYQVNIIDFSDEKPDKVANDILVCYVETFFSIATNCLLERL